MRCAMTLSIFVAAASPAFAQVSVTFRNTAALPDTTVDQFNQPFTITGLSGISPDVSSSSSFWAVMDNSNKLIRIQIAFAPDGSIVSATVLGGLTLSESGDYEGIVIDSPTHAYLAEESTPTIRTVNLTTGFVHTSVQIPPVYSNIRPNLGFESLGGDGGALWTANEEALTVDGPVSTSSEGTVVRIGFFFNEGGFLLPMGQYAYKTESYHGAAISGARSGLCELVNVGPILALERSFAFSASGFFQTRIYELDFANATGVSEIPALAGAIYTRVAKRLLYQGDQQNLEGLCRGPSLGPGRYALVGIVDDGDPISTNRLVAFEVSGIPLPPCYANCDGSTVPPRLTPNDFACFLNAFAGGASYANCDGSPNFSLTPNDFICYINRYSQGCS